MGLLRAADSQPVIAERSGSNDPFLFISDHAGRDVPSALGRLGLPEAAFDLHIAWDIGAADVTRRLAASLNAPCILQRYSRLVVDCNRDPSTPGAIPAVSDGVAIPGNQDLGAEDRLARIEAIHAPYHAAIATELDRRQARGAPTILVFMHSFTPRMDGFDRPWRFGVIREPGSRFSQLALKGLQAAGDFEVGDNLPYAMDGTDYSAPTHAFARGLDYLELEMRQDTIADGPGQADTVRILREVLVQAAAGL
jgi:predicted N-formylglutamate amidohydrolase